MLLYHAHHHRSAAGTFRFSPGARMPPVVGLERLTLFVPEEGADGRFQILLYRFRGLRGRFQGLGSRFQGLGSRFQSPLGRGRGVGSSLVVVRVGGRRSVP